jgi:hypothetical protein
MEHNTNFYKNRVYLQDSKVTSGFFDSDLDILRTINEFFWLCTFSNTWQSLDSNTIKRETPENGTEFPKFPTLFKYIKYVMCLRNLSFEWNDV